MLNGPYLKRRQKIFFFFFSVAIDLLIDMVDEEGSGSTSLQAYIVDGVTNFDSKERRI